MKQSPIGIFDSGIGGLTTAYAIKQLLPDETLLYVADLQHFPYGEKTAAQIQHYSLVLTNWLLAQGCKMIVIACNTAASLVADKIAKETPVADPAIVVDVISPMVAYVGRHYAGKKVGLIGTQRTIDSKIYLRLLTALTANIDLRSIATPLLAPYIENHYEHDMDCYELLTTYLSKPELQHLDALILACTHYPFIKNQFCNYYRHQLKIIDPSELVAKFVAKSLQENKLLNDCTGRKAKQTFFTTKASLRFSQVVSKFFAVRAKLLVL